MTKTEENERFGLKEKGGGGSLRIGSIGKKGEGN
jgi:hypothetical protein